jgi:hypothetical protein
MDDTKVAVAVELTATVDRRCVMVVLRSDERIPIDVVAQALEGYSAEIKSKLTKSQIEVQTPKIITP